MGHEREYTAYARAALVALWLREGQRLSSAELAQRLGLTRQGADYLLDSLSRAVPVCKLDDGRWAWWDGGT